MRLIKDLQAETGTAVLLITHDLGIVAEMADEVAVMYAGKVVESGPCRSIFSSFLHPYTEGLFKSLPGRTETRVGVFIPLPVPFLQRRSFPPGCRFHTRCPLVIEQCRTEEPPLGRS